MKNTILLAALIVPALAGSIINCLAQPTEAQQIQTLQKQLSSLKKTSKQQNEQMQRDIEFLQIGNYDINRSLEAQNNRIITNKILIQGTIEGTIAQIKDEQQATSQGYARTKKIVRAALAAGGIAGCAFILALILIHRRNKNNFSLLEKTLTQHKAELDLLTRIQEKDSADLKTELNQLRAEWRLGAETRQNAIEETRLRVTAIETAAAARQKFSDERATSQAHFQQVLEDKLTALKQSAENETRELKKHVSGIEESVKLLKGQITLLKIKEQ